MTEWKDFSDSRHQTGIDILNKKTGKILYNKKIRTNTFNSDYYKSNVPVSHEIGYLNFKYIYDKGERPVQEYKNPIVLADHQFRDWGETRDETIKKYLKVGDFVELRGIRDTNSFRKITAIGDNRIFGIKYVIERRRDGPGQLTMVYETSDNYIRFVTGILDEDELNKGNWVTKVDFSKNKEY